MSRWRDRARRRIAELTKDLPEDATLEQRRKALWGKGYPAHDGSNWGRKMWGKEVRAYLASYGDSYARAPGKQAVFPDHVHFPFREVSQ